MSGQVVEIEQSDTNYTAKDYRSELINDWCAGCGDHGILRALEKALAGLGRAPDRVAVFGGIGCSGKTPYYLKTYGVHTLHGRVLPFASGAKLANPQLTVIAVGGDGDGLSIGAGHFVNAGRRNLDLTYILFNNGVYGLTKGQAAPTLRPGEQTKSMPLANIQGEVNPIMLALTSGYTWIGRSYAYNVAELAQLIQQAIRHPGISFLEVLQPCPAYNDLHSKAFYDGKDLPSGQSRLYSLQDEGYDPVIPQGGERRLAEVRRFQCMQKALEWGDRIPTGIFLQDLTRIAFLQELNRRQPHYLKCPPAQQPVVNADGHSLMDLGALFDELTVTEP